MRKIDPALVEWCDFIGGEMDGKRVLMSDYINRITAVFDIYERISPVKFKFVETIDDTGYWRWLWGRLHKQFERDMKDLRKKQEEEK